MYVCMVYVHTHVSIPLVGPMIMYTHSTHVRTYIHTYVCMHVHVYCVYLRICVYTYICTNHTLEGWASQASC